jgi:hypothetical protein
MILKPPTIAMLNNNMLINTMVTIIPRPAQIHMACE